MKINEIYEGDCLDVMRGFPDNCIDSIITDPPYNLTGKSGNGGFMGKKWDSSGIAFNPEVWAEALRIAKPGATLLAFGGTRTYHRLVCAIEDAGWEIRDCIMWVYGSGFPKSHNVSVGIDKANGAVREVVGYRPIAYPDSDCWGTPNKNDNGDVHKENVYTPLGNIENGKRPITAPTTPLARTFDGYGSALKPAYEPIVVAMAPMGQSYAANAEEWGVSGLWIEGARVGTEQTTTTIKDLSEAHGNQFGKNGITYPKIGEKVNPPGRWPANLIHSGEPEVLAEFDKAGVRTSGEKTPTGKANKFNGKTLNKSNTRDNTYSVKSEGSAARYFQQCPPDPTAHPEAARFRYCPKAPPSERSTPGNNHPTQKPLSLMRYLARLTRPPDGGIVLDPFGGSGTTALACLPENRDFILIEKEADYAETARRRIAEYSGEEIAPIEREVNEDVVKQMSLW